MMSVIHLTSSTFLGGPERQMLGLAQTLVGEVRTIFFSFGEGGRCRAFLNEALQQGFEAHALEHDTPHFGAAVRSRKGPTTFPLCQKVGGPFRPTAGWRSVGRKSLICPKQSPDSVTY